MAMIAYSLLIQNHLSLWLHKPYIQPGVSLSQVTSRLAHSIYHYYIMTITLAIMLLQDLVNIDYTGGLNLWFQYASFQTTMAHSW